MMLRVNTKHLYNIYTMLNQRRRRWADVVYMFFKCFAFIGEWTPRIFFTLSVLRPISAKTKRSRTVRGIQLFWYRLQIYCNHRCTKNLSKLRTSSVTTTQHIALCGDIDGSNGDNLNQRSQVSCQRKLIELNLVKVDHVASEEEAH